ncbi:MAG: MgtC/SapB family protein [Aquificae bacterium]|nr:MgtC/SapB family protein [Aquificota bacterium]
MSQDFSPENIKASAEFKLLFSLFLGFIVGLEREVRAKFGHDAFAGIRTFPLIALLGTVSGLLSREEGLVLLPLVSFLGLLLLAAVSYWKDRSVGITTEVASFITFLAGLLVSYERFYLATFLVITTTFLLVLKKHLESLARRLEEEDVLAVLKFFTLTAVILPLLPDRELFPGFNPSQVWKFVILVSTVDFVGYFLLKYKGIQSVVITAFVGGLASSTAVTLAFSELSRKFPYFSKLLFVSVMFSWQIMFLRVLFYVVVVSPHLLPQVVKLLLPYSLALLLFTLLVYLRREKEPFGERNISLKNPYSLTQALTFGLLYTLISVSSVYLKKLFGDTGIYALSFISGVMDVDAVTLFLASAFAKGELPGSVAALSLALAVSSNNLFKSFYGMLFGGESFRRYFLFPLALTLLYLLLLLLFLLA